MPLNHRRQTAWPLRPNGMRRRASASQVLEPGFKVSRPASWLLRVFALVAIAVPSLLVTSPGYVAFADKLPDPDAVTSATPEDTLIYAEDNKTLLADLHPPGYQAYFEPLSQMGSLLPAAVISIEDRNFYSEPGIDPQGIVRASIVDLRTHSNAEGASTITQQLVKLRLVGNDATLDRKMREALLAFQIERKYTKDQILEWYLNSVFFANTAWGTAAASKIYFHTTTSKLDLAQASMLAGIIRGPRREPEHREASLSKCHAGRIGVPRSNDRRDHRDGRVREPERIWRSVQPRGMASAQPRVVDEDLHVHRSHRQQEVHDDDTDPRQQVHLSRAWIDRVLYAAELRWQDPRHLSVAGVHGQLAEHPRGQGRAWRGSRQCRADGARHGCAAVPAARRRCLWQTSVHPQRPA